MIRVAVIVALIVANCIAAEPISARARAFPHYISVAIELTPHPDNANVQVAVTALDHVPDSWARATVYHQNLLEAPTETDHFIDEWSDMEPGRYRIEVELSRGADVFKAAAQEVLVLP